MIGENSIKRPTLVVNEEQAKANIRRMAEKAKNSGVRFRPHFKTHQSAEVGEWFREAGVRSITVSSCSMANYFADSGWTDITLAFLLNLREMDDIKDLASRVNLGLIVDSSDAIEALAEQIDTRIDVWIKVDTGYGRSGVRWDQTDTIMRLAKRLNEFDQINIKGLLTHNGHSYKVQGEKGIKEIYKESTKRLNVVYDILFNEGFENIERSTGDTPCCSVIDDFSDVDEIRPGNFVYYDLMQTEIGSCSDDQIAAVVACPVVGIYPEREEIVIYGGGVHLSKESINVVGQKVFGCLAEMNGDAIDTIRRDSPVVSLSQEHGTIHIPNDILNKIKIGDIVHIVTVHSCMAVSCLRQ